MIRMNIRRSSCIARKIYNNLPKVAIRSKFAIVLIALATPRASATAQESRADEWLKKSSDLLKKGSFKEALNASDEALKLDPQNAEAWRIKGTALGCLGSYNDSIEAYKKALDISNKILQTNPQDAKAWSVKGDILAGLSRHDEALNAYAKATELCPNNATFFANKALCLEMMAMTTNDQRKFKASLQAYDKAIELEPGNAENLLQKGYTFRSIAYGLEGQERVRAFEDAIKAFDKAIELDPNYVEAWHGKGIIFDDLAVFNNEPDRYNQSLSAYDRAIELTADNETRRLALAYEGKAVALSHMGRDLPESESQAKYVEALKYYDKVIRLDPNCIEAWNGIGVALKTLSRDADANAAFAKAKELGYQD